MWWASRPGPAGGALGRGAMGAGLLPIGCAALASAVLYLAAAVGSIAAFPLLYLAPLPLFLVGLALGGPAAGLAGAAAALAAALAGSALGGIAYLVCCALPVAVLCDKAAQSRPAAAGGAPAWYPPGPLCVWLTAPPISALLLANLYFVGSGGLEAAVADEVAGVMELYRSLLGAAPEGAAPGGAVPDGAIPEGAVPGGAPAGDAPAGLDSAGTLLAMGAPAMLAGLWMTLIAVNGALAQGLLSRFGRNLRPAPRLAEIDLPRPMVAAFVACLVAGTTLDGAVGYLGFNLAGVLAFPLFLSGLGVAHAAAARTRFRAGVLVAVYGALLLSRWGALALVGLGLIDHFARLKARLRGRSNTV